MRIAVSKHLESLSLKTRAQVRNLGVLIDSDLTFSSHIKSITKTAFYQLKNISRVKGFMSQTDQEKLIHAFISSRLDYCNGLLTGLPQKSIKQLQLIQNAAARVLTRTKRSEHITPVLKSLHWLPVSYRINVKVLLLCVQLLDFCARHRLSKKNTMFKHKGVHMCTWHQDTLGRSSIIDLIVVSSDLRPHVLDTRAKRGAELSTDHHLVVSWLRWWGRMPVRPGRPKRIVRVCWERLQSLLSERATDPPPGEL